MDYTTKTWLMNRSGPLSPNQSTKTQARSSLLRMSDRDTSGTVSPSMRPIGCGHSAALPRGPNVRPARPDLDGEPCQPSRSKPLPLGRRSQIQTSRLAPAASRGHLLSRTPRHREGRREARADGTAGASPDQCAVANSLGNRRTFASHLFRSAGESLANASHA